MNRRLVEIGAIDLLLLGGAYLLEQTNAFNASVISWAVAAIGIVTFVGALSSSDRKTKVTTRFALTTAVAAVWFASVGALLFYQGVKGPLADQAFQNVSLVMGVVVAFYFGAQAYQAVGEAKAKSDGGGSPANLDQEQREILD